MADRSPVARFLDPWTLVYERTYPHPIERVFEAVSTGEHLDAWFIPTCTVERRIGGACSFSWGGPPGSGGEPGTVTRFEPPHLIRYTLGHGAQGEQYLQFELETTADGTRLRFTQAFPQGSENPWRAGFAEGFHLSLGTLGKFLAGLYTRADKDAALAYLKDHPWGNADDTYWLPVYGELSRTQWPARHIRSDGARCQAVEAYLSALIVRSDDALAELRRCLADDVVFESGVETRKGPDEVLENLLNPRLAAVFADILSTEIVGATDTGVATARVRLFKPRTRFIGFDYAFELRDGRLTRIAPKLVSETE